MNLPRLAVLCDLVEEGWTSMDLLGEMLVGGLQARHADTFRVTRVCPAAVRGFGRLPWLGGRPALARLDRFANRFWHYPRLVARERAHHDLFHVVDHSYAHLAHRLPAASTGVFCYDLDAFCCLLEPGRERRPLWFRAMARHTLRGLQKASVVFHLSMEVRRQIESYGLLDPSRLVHAPPGVSAEFTAEEPSSGTEGPGWPGWVGVPFLLHVGSCIPRKRIDVLLDVFAEVRATHRELRLVQVGGRWTAAQEQQIARRGIAPAVTQLRGLSRAAVAGLYRKAALVLLPTEAEGFGLPLIEALACGAAVVASDLPVLREVASEAATYCPVGDVAAWSAAVRHLLGDPTAAPERARRLTQARRYSWQRHTQTICEAYQRLLGISPRQPEPM